MPAMMTMRYDDAAIRSLEHRATGIRGGLASIVSPAINRVLSWSRTQMRRKVAEQARMKQKSLDRMLKTDRAGRSKLNGHVEIQNRRIPIGKFIKSRGRGTQLAATFPSGQSRSYPRSFFAKMPSGHRGVFTRARVVKPGTPVRRPEHIGRNRRGWYKYGTELPIWQVSERIGTVVDMGFLPGVHRQGSQRLYREILSKIKWRLDRAGRTG